MKSTFKQGIELLKREWKSALIGSVICLVTGFLSSLLAGDFEVYEDLIRPPFSPPPIVFPIVWTILYILIGASAALLLKSMCQSADKDRATLLFVTMLLFNFLWSPLFFGLGSYYAALVDLVIITVLTIAMYRYYRKCFVPGFYVMLLYTAWLFYAFYLNLGTALLNR